MPLIGFTVMKDKVKDGRKRQTIRVLRKYPIKVGDILYIYWKLRTKFCEKLREEKCIDEFQIQMAFYENWLNSGKPVWRVDRIYYDGSVRQLLDFEIEDLARKDGFDDALQMMRWFSKRHKDLHRKTFQVIRW